MAKYQWETGEILLNMMMIAGILKTEKNAKERNNIKEQLNKYKEMLEKSRNTEALETFYEYSSGREEIDESEIEYDEMTEDDIKFVNALKDNDLNSPAPKFTRNVILPRDNILRIKLYKTSSILDNININPEYDNHKFDLTEDELIELSEEILEAKADEETWLKFKELKEDNPNFLHILDKPIYESKASTYHGFTYIDHISKQKYIIADKIGDYNDLTTLLHEMFHFIFNDYDNKITSQYQTNYISEIEGKFAEFLGADFFYDKDKDKYNYIIKQWLSQYKRTVDKILITSNYLLYWGDDDICEFPIEDQIALRECSMLVERNQEEWLGTPLSELIRYCISYLAALDLYEIYKKDNSKAFEILRNIKRAPASNDLLKLLRDNGITFMDDKGENLQKLVNSLEKQTTKKLTL